jgi:hypothetical protein
VRKNPRHLERGWKSFERAAIAPGASDTQRDCMRDAFYAGAMIAFRTLVSETSEGDEILPADMYLMVDIDAEIADFQREIDARCVRAKAASS